MDSLQPARGYAEDFDADWYLDNYIRTLRQQQESGGILPFALDFLHDTFNTRQYAGDKLLDIGTGPTIHSVISASRHVREVHVSDIVPRNRDILQKWRDGESYIAEVFEYICKKENEGTSIKERMDMVRQKVTQVKDIDMRQPDPLPGEKGMYDIIVASLLLCSIATNKEEFSDLLRKVIDLLKPGGNLVVIGVLNTKYYRVGDFRFTAPDIERHAMKGLFEKAGLKILDWRETSPKHYEPEYKKKGYSVEEGVFGMMAQKI